MQNQIKSRKRVADHGEVFTPAEFVNRRLDTLAEPWAADHAGANIWVDKTVKFLDPCTKSGVSPREITRPLKKGLEDELPDLEERLENSSNSRSRRS
jgi:site-specific DNA-methyltransferase (adenine-specific)